MLKKKVDGLEDYYYQWMNKYKDDADRRLELLNEAPNPFGNFTGRYPVALEDWRKRYEDWYKQVKKELADA